MDIEHIVYIITGILVTGTLIVRPGGHFSRWVAPWRLSVLLGVALCASAYFFTRPVLRLETEGMRATGVIEDVKYADDSSSPAIITVIRFTDARNHSITFETRADWRSQAGYQKGDRAPVLYLKDNPQKTARLDDAAVWLPAAGFWSVGLYCLGMGIWRSRREP
jgi:hypothetical protein